MALDVLRQRQVRQQRMKPPHRLQAGLARVEAGIVPIRAVDPADVDLLVVLQWVRGEVASLGFVLTSGAWVNAPQTI